jgi:DNA-binding NarL/FixJ family response regulator
VGVCDDPGVRKRVLIVDDHEPFRAVARELLERAGFVVAGEAGDAAEALAAVAADAPDAVLLDVQLPDRDGFAVATALAAADGPAVVLISSREADDYGNRVAACGARGFILKSKLSAATFAALLQ